MDDPKPLTDIFTIEKCHFRGDGMARTADGRMIRIANAWPGEIVKARDVSVERCRQAALVEVLQPSPHRVPPLCGQFQRCAACQFQTLSPSAQQTTKKQNWIRLFGRFVELKESTILDFCAPAQITAYRHRTEASVTHGILGLAPRNDVARLETLAGAPHPLPVDMTRCALHAPELNALMADVQARLAALGLIDGMKLGVEAMGDPHDASGTDWRTRRLTVYADPSLQDAARATSAALSRAFDTASVVCQILPPHGSHVYPKPECFSDSEWYRYDTVPEATSFGGPLLALKGAWTPVSPANAHLIRDTLSRLLSPFAFEHLLELGCGCGTHAALLCRHADHYVGIDASWPAILSAQKNAAIHGWENAAFYTDTAEHYLDKRYYQGRRANAVVMHSNRMPYSRRVAEWCMRFGARHLFIVGPTAYALAQECRHFVDLGYSLHTLTLCDTMPMTYHMMGVAYLAR